MASDAETTLPAGPCLAVHAARDRARALVRAAFPRRRSRVVFVRDAGELRRLARAELVDAVLVDLASAGTNEAWRVAELAPTLPSAPFVGLLSLRSSDGDSLARCAALGLADVLIDGTDDAVVRAVVVPLLFTTRFSTALAHPPPELALRRPLQRAAWTRIVGAAGRLARTDDLASALAVSREHLSRSFGPGGPSLKRVIDLVRVVAAAELARNPGCHLRDVAAVLGFASGSHLAHATFRVAGLAPSALATVTAAELVQRFVARTDRVGGGAAPADRVAAAQAAGGVEGRDWDAAMPGSAS